MAKFTLSIEDTEEDSIQIQGGFDPPIDGQIAAIKLTPAQSTGFAILAQLDGLITTAEGVLTGRDEDNEFSEGA